MTQCKSGVGRIVWGNPGKAQIKRDQTTKEPKLDKNGNQIQQWAFGVAFPKAEFQQLIWPAMAEEAATGFPNGVPNNFAWKYTDGDTVDHKGVPYANREGYAGNIILNITTELMAPPIYKFENGQYVQMSGDQIKCGDFVVVPLKFKVNVPTVPTHQPSLYVNPELIEFIGYGTEIQHGPDPQELLGGQQYQLPPGASATPLAPNAPSMQTPGQPMQPQQPMQQPQQPMQQPQQPMQQPQQPMQQPTQQPQQPMQQPQQPQQPMQQPQQPMQQPMQPATDFVQNAGQQPQQPMQQPQQPQQPMQQPGMMPNPNQ